MQVDKLPINDDILRKPKVTGDMKELDKVPVPSKPEIYISTFGDKLKDAKNIFLEQFPNLLRLAISGSWIRIILIVVCLILLFVFGLKIL